MMIQSKCVGLCLTVFCVLMMLATTALGAGFFPLPPTFPPIVVNTDMFGKIYIDRQVDTADSPEYKFYPYDYVSLLSGGSDPVYIPIYNLDVDVYVPDAIKSFKVSFFHGDSEKNTVFIYSNDPAPYLSELNAAQIACDNAGKPSEQCIKEFEAINEKVFYAPLTDLNCQKQAIFNNYHCVANLKFQAEFAYNFENWLGGDMDFVNSRPLMFQDYCNSNFQTPPHYLSTISPTQCSDSLVLVEISTTTNKKYTAILLKQNSFYWHVNKATGNPLGEIISSKPNPTFSQSNDLYPGYVNGPCSCADQNFFDCSDANQCDDNNDCTIDTCSEIIGCRHEVDTSNPICCKKDSDCSDGNACNGIEQCVNNTCQAGENKSCNDGNICTQDSCSQSTGQCVHTSIDSCCSSNADCSDGQVCTNDICNITTGQCSNNLMSDCCQSDTDCTDGNNCTTDSCNKLTGQCTNATIAGCCLSHSDCNDADICTTDSCNVQTGQCSNITIGDCCKSDSDCSDGNVCTQDVCNQATGECANNSVAGCCQSDTECADNNACTVDTCDKSTGQCTNQKTADCCLTDAECSDGNACTQDICNLQNNKCESKSVADCCLTNSDCSDGNACTTDQCDLSTHTCVNQEIANCCLADEQCKDSNVCTTDACVNHSCQYGSVADCCQSDSDCNDNNVCTTDKCNQATGECTNAANTLACNDGNDCTLGDTCQQGICQGKSNLNCDDQDICTDDQCIPGKGCINTPNNIPQCVDLCPNNPDKQAPGICGCDTADVDNDGDGVMDCKDNCPSVINPTQADDDQNGVGNACETPTIKPPKTPEPQGPVEDGGINCAESVDFDSPKNVIPIDELRKMARAGGGEYVTSEGVVMELAPNGNEVTIKGACSDVTVPVGFQAKGGVSGCSLSMNTGMKNSSNILYVIPIYLLALGALSLALRRKLIQVD